MHACRSTLEDPTSDALAREREERKLPEFLRPEQVRELINAARSHSAEVEAFVRTVLLTGCRLGEILALRWDAIDLDRSEIRVKPTATKTRIERIVDLAICPSVVATLRALPRTGDRVFESFTDAKTMHLTRQLQEKHGAPKFSWQLLRSTCATVLTNAAGIFGAATAFRSAMQLGHSVTVAQKHYLGLLRDLPKDATTLERALGIDKLPPLLVEAAPAPRQLRKVE